ncbi:unnamed protein product [Dimorphilus gyrociliatus]|uniref:Uncharacterized protein n=1 Tax=Dimorphilus gyrociliatus TaxID=2664684 RepID=A0A7I8WF66_9ANNE|nr:unnamed protein product [Dimorphilus gyrociliatus]CAD5126769.1 unnamed protein product [Dimorphilus gyrociliatus]
MDTNDVIIKDLEMRFHEIWLQISSISMKSFQVQLICQHFGFPHGTLIPMKRPVDMRMTGLQCRKSYSLLTQCRTEFVV